MYAPILHVLACASHAGLPAQANWYPWSDDTQSFIGWRIQSHTDGSESFLYVVPDLEATVPAVEIFFGPHGNPLDDQRLEYIET